MTKARDLANLISTGAVLADGAIAVAEVTGAAPLASPTFTGTLAAPTVNASTALQIGGTAITVGASDINTVTAKAPLASPTFTGDVTLADKIVHASDTNTAIRFPANDTVAFETGGSERFRFAAAGQLGIAGANYGTSGQVFQSGGASGAASWADAGGGGTELLATASPSNVSSAQLTIPTGYFALMFVYDKIVPVLDDRSLHMQIRNGTTNRNSRYALYVARSNSAYSEVSKHQNRSGVFNLSPYAVGSDNTNSDFDGASGTVMIYGASTNTYTNFTVNTCHMHTSDMLMTMTGGGRMMTSEVCNNVMLEFNTGNIKSGTMKLYGLKAS
jgi:hypothetical protein